MQTRGALLEQAVTKALGGNRQLVLEASNGAKAAAPVAAAPTPNPVTPPVIQPIAPSATTLATTNATKPEASAEVDPISPPTPAPVAAPAASPTPAVQAQAPNREQPIARPTDPRPKPDPQAPPAVSSDIERHAKTLANFFNGEVLAVDDIETATNTEPNKAKEP